ncbi:urease accessory protein UreE [Maritimibacter sp. DP1N21-5]|uniref:urease accessory protein UreE n=1 Tax=Maritimibacter sp. DP1N21-5 TaxID=2836867 RepID=UPI001C44C1FA|nr:urease accessory protein UreE [Maritimibacter sp. DP1N21-5]MBV7408524.1 urease accessory protein UreE [Maritimibacter sp. DP1N21-5]
MTRLPTAETVAHVHHPDLEVVLTYDERFLRRKVLTTTAGERFLVDLPKTTSVGAFDAFVLDDGRRVGVVAAQEALIEVTGPDILRLAWHIGNRHTPAEIDSPNARILIKRDHVLADMLIRLGATLLEIEAPFTPEGGAYGHGRTHGHDHSHGHGPTAGDHDHDHEHGHEGPDHAH